MPLIVPCPKCPRRLSVPGRAFGRPVTCPECRTRFTAPAAAGGDPAASDPPPTARRVVARPADDDDDDERDEPRRPARRPASRSRARRGVPRWALAAGALAALVALVAVGVGGWLAWRAFGGVPGPPAPPGYSVAASRRGGYRVFLPGPVAKPSTTYKNIETKELDRESHGHNTGVDRETFAHATVNSRLAPGGGAPGTTLDELTAGAKADPSIRFALDSPFNYEPEVEPITLGGRPGLLIRIKSNPDWMADRGSRRKPPPPGPDPDAGARGSTRTSTVIAYTRDERRVYTIRFEKNGDYWDPEVVRTVTDSFTILD